MSLVVERAGLTTTQGEPRFWSRAADSGGRVRCAFCAACGSRLWHEPEGSSQLAMIKAGALDRPVDAGVAIHIWTARKLPGIVIPAEATQFPGEPPASG